MKNLFLFFACALFAFSCAKDDNPAILKENNVEMDQYLEFSYKGKAYASKYAEIDSLLVFEDKEVQAVYDEIGKNENRLVHFKDEKVTIYETYEEYEAASALTTKAQSSNLPYVSYVIKFYNHTSTFVFGSTSPHIVIDQMKVFPTNYAVNSSNSKREVVHSVPDYKAYSFNDRLSKIYIELCKGNMSPSFNINTDLSLYFYEHKNYEGDWTYEANCLYNQPKTPGSSFRYSETINMRNLYFNDKTSSHKLFLKCWRRDSVIP